MPQEPEFEVRNPEIEQRLGDIAKKIHFALEDTGYGFALLIFQFGKGGNMFYISDSQRLSMIEAMEEFIKVIGE